MMMPMAPMVPMAPMAPMAPSAAASRQYQIGDRVQALYSENGDTDAYWYDARIRSRVQGKPDTYEIAWEEPWLDEYLDDLLTSGRGERLQK